MDTSAASAEPERVSKSTSDHQVDEAEIVERIYNAVMERRLGPAQKLGENRLCEAFGVSRARVRSALLLLSNQGIVDLKSNKGAFVASPDRTEANEIFDARSMLEPAIARQVAVEISPADLTMLKQHIVLEDEARKNGHGAALIRLSGEFHVKVALASGNSVLKRVVRELVTKSSLIVGLFGTSNRTVCPDDEHSVILNEIERGDSDAAAAHMFEHLVHIRSGLDLSAPRPEKGDLTDILGRR